MGKTPKKATPGGDERNLYNRRLKATTAPPNPSETSLHKRQRESKIPNRFVKPISPTNSKFMHSFSVQSVACQFLLFIPSFVVLRKRCSKSFARLFTCIVKHAAVRYFFSLFFFFPFKNPRISGASVTQFRQKITIDIYKPYTNRGLSYFFIYILNALI